MRSCVAAVGWLLLMAGGASAQDPIDRLVEELGVDRAELRADPLALLNSRDRDHQSPLLRAALAEPMRLAWRVGTMERRFVDRSDSVHRLVMYTGGLAGADIARGYLDNPLAVLDREMVRQDDPLAWAIGMAGGDASGLPTMEQMPLRFRAEVARLVVASLQADSFLNRAFRDLPRELTADMLQEQVFESRFSDDVLDYRILVDRIEYEALVGGLLDLTAAVEDFDDYLASSPELPEVSFSVETRHGLVRVSTGKTDDSWSGVAPLLSIDLYGNDRLEVSGRERGARVSTIIDNAGDDVYTGAVARGILGVGVLWDRGGNDRYEGSGASQSAALFGASLLYEGGGNDVYTSQRFSQAAAIAGAALLVDRGGNDLYKSLTMAEASGGPRGAAVLLDLSGDDVYAMTGGPVLRNSPQLPGRNSSQGQGCGWGLRADLSDGRSVSGGVGVLIDVAGADRYEADVFAQGSGFYEGLGALVDNAGDDVYTAPWYGMAAGAHRAAGVLIDRGGNDVYTASHYTSIAAAHDGSVAVLVDEAGDDRYSARNLGIGGAHDGGVAIFCDNGGDDRYTLLDKAGHGFGSARITHYGTAREESPALGLFLDGGGVDRYETPRPGPADNALWRGAADYPELRLPSERGAGIDGDWSPVFRTVPRTAPGKEDEKNLRAAEKSRREWRLKLPNSL
ncbi:hypothetical protein GC173_02350 [bacterium]|nr:hypothetical protein [bacterium]